jgi:hypothetical protein
MFSCFAFASCIPGGMTTSEPPAGGVKSPDLLEVVSLDTEVQHPVELTGGPDDVVAVEVLDVEETEPLWTTETEEVVRLPELLVARLVYEVASVVCDCRDILYE